MVDTNVQNDFLVALLSLTSKVINNTADIASESDTINTVTTTDSTFTAQVESTITSLLPKYAKSSTTVLKNAVNSLTCLDEATKASFLGLIDSYCLDLSDRDAVTTFINAALEDTTPKTYIFYAMIARFSINLQNTTLIGKAIQKFQALS